jgi:hypothetical protein
VAVVQISRIQVRRGQKNQGSGLPQLASGELGWAVDSQELFIGNGAVSEGAPAVGNTKVLTQHDNIFEFANTYIYRPGSIVQTGATSTTPIARNLQDRLDDIVSIRSFGALGDGTECSDAFQRALDQLYLNTNKANPSSRVILYVEPGEYLFNKPVYIPPYATIIGAGVNKTIISHTADANKVTTGPVFRTVNGDSQIGIPSNDANTTYANQAKNICLEGMTIRTTGPYGGIRLQSTRDSQFKDLRFEGEFTIGDTLQGSNIAIRLNSFSTEVTCRDNTFSDIEIVGYSYAVESRYDIADNVFDKFTIDNCAFGFVFGDGMNPGLPGQTSGPINNTIKDGRFGTGPFGIERYGIQVVVGYGNSSHHNKFYDVGNAGGGYGNPVYSNIFFNAPNNTTLDDYFERTKYLTADQNFISGTPFVPNVEGIAIFDTQVSEVNIAQYTSPTRIFRLPGSSSTIYDVDYWYSSTAVDAMRNGKLTISLDYANNDVKLIDEYNYIGASTYENNIEFSVQTSDEDVDSDIDTIVVLITNATSSDSGKLRFKVSTKTEI